MKDGAKCWKKTTVLEKIMLIASSGVTTKCFTQFQFLNTNIFLKKFVHKDLRLFLDYYPGK